MNLSTGLPWPFSEARPVASQQAPRRVQRIRIPGFNRFDRRRLRKKSRRPSGFPAPGARQRRSWRRRRLSGLEPIHKLLRRRSGSRRKHRDRHRAEERRGDDGLAGDHGRRTGGSCAGAAAILGVFEGERYFSLSRGGEGARLAHGERFSGAALWFLDAQVFRTDFEAMNEALAKRVASLE